MIKLKIERSRELTPEEREITVKDRIYGSERPYLPSDITESILEVEITEEQFETLRRGVIEIF